MSLVPILDKNNEMSTGRKSVDFLAPITSKYGSNKVNQYDGGDDYAATGDFG